MGGGGLREGEKAAGKGRVIFNPINVILHFLSVYHISQKIK
jgi:hypothetical protein